MSSIVVAGDTSGSITIAAPAVAGSGTLTLPVATDTLVGKATTDTLTNKSIAATQLTGTLAVANGGTGVTTSTGTGAVVLGTSPTLTTPTFDSAQLTTISGTAPLYMCRAWVNFNGTGVVAIRASGNVSSITDNGVGDYTVNFTTAMADNNYFANTTAMVAGANSTVNASFATIYGNATYGNAYATTSIRVLSQDYVSVVKDCFAMNVSVFR